MRELILHAGLHKTATTYVQHVLLANRARLAAAGVELAPFLHPNEGNHYPLIAALRAGRFEAAAFERVLAAIAAAPAARLLVSAEELCTTILEHPERAVALQAAAARHFRPRVLVTLRRQDHLQESIFGQAARTWYTGGIRSYTDYNLDHDARLKTIEAAFGRENVSVMIYQDSRRQDVLADFLAALGVDLDPAGLAAGPPRNRSMHRRQILFMAALPKDPRAAVDRRYMDFTTRLARLLRESDAIADDGGHGLLSPRERHDLVARHLAGNRAVAERYRLDPAATGSFLALPDPAAAWSPPAPITAAERRAAFIVVLKGFCARRNLAAAFADSTRAGTAVYRMGRA